MNRHVAAGTATQPQRLVFFDGDDLDAAIADETWISCANPTRVDD